MWKLKVTLWPPAIAIWLIAAPVIAPVNADDIPIIDAHSQIDHLAELARVVPLLDRAGVSRVILAARGRRHWRDIAGLAARHPGRVTASVRTKSEHGHIQPGGRLCDQGLQPGVCGGP